MDEAGEALEEIGLEVAPDFGEKERQRGSNGGDELVAVVGVDVACVHVYIVAVILGITVAVVAVVAVAVVAVVAVGAVGALCADAGCI